MTKSDFQPNFDSQNVREQMAKEIENRLISRDRDYASNRATETAVNASKFLREVRRSNSTPFFRPHNLIGWFDFEFFPRWFAEDIVTAAETAGVVCNPDNDAIGEVFTTAGYGMYPFTYNILSRIVSTGQYLNYSMSQQHFGIEPMVDTIKELASFETLFDNLLEKMARLLLQVYHQN
jgi:hypothetical protein